MKKSSLPSLQKLQTWLLAGVVAGGLLSGCASNPAQTTDAPSSESIVRQRAQERWKFLVVRNFEKAYEFLPPSYRALKTPDEYRSSFGNGAGWKNPVVDSIQCENTERCVLNIKLDVVVVASGFYKPIPSDLKEVWIQEDGQWWAYEKH